MTARSLRAWRLRLGLTQPQMAAALGISRSTWIRYERGPAPKWVGLVMRLPLPRSAPHGRVHHREHPMMSRYEVTEEATLVYVVNAESEEDACHRVIDGEGILVVDQVDERYAEASPIKDPHPTT